LAQLVGWQEGHPACKKYGEMVEVGTGWHWAPSQMVAVSAWLLIFPCTISPEFLFWHRLTRVVPEKGP